MSFGHGSLFYRSRWSVLVVDTLGTLFIIRSVRKRLSGSTRRLSYVRLPSQCIGLLVYSNVVMYFRTPASAPRPRRQLCLACSIERDEMLPPTRHFASASLALPATRVGRGGQHHRRRRSLHTAVQRRLTKSLDFASVLLTASFVARLRRSFLLGRQ